MAEGSSGPARRASALLPRLAFAALCVFALVYAVELRQFGFNPGDEGVATMGAWRILDGQQPHRDFFEITPPASFLPTALVFRLGGVDLASARALVLLYALLLMLLAERLLTCYTRSLLARSVLVAVLIPMGVSSWPMPSHHWFVDIVQLAALLALLRGLSRRPLPWGAVAGVLTALGCFGLQDQGGYLLVGLLLAFFPWLPGPQPRRGLLLGWIAGGLATAAVFALWLLPGVGPGELFRQWVVHPWTRYKRIPGNQGGFARGLELLGTERWDHLLASYPDYALGWLVLAVSLLLLPLLAMAILAWAGLRGWHQRARLGLLWAGLIAFAGAALHRYSVQNVCWAAPLPLVVLGLLIARWHQRGGRWQRLGAGAGAGLLLLASLAYAGSQLRLTADERVTRVDASAGSLEYYRNSRAAGMQAVLDAVEQHLPPGAPLFCTRFNPLINFWTLRPNPTRYNFLIYPEYHTDAQLDEIVGDLEREPAASVLLFLPFPLDNPLGDHLRRRLKPVWRTPFAVLLVPDQTGAGAQPER